jgi:superfamily II DNA helicase RecQ
MMQGVDLPDIELVIQWRATCDLCTLWQRFGRAARDLKLTAKALFLVEPKHFDEVRAGKATRQEEKKRKAAGPTEQNQQNQRPTKRPRVHVPSDTGLAQWAQNSGVTGRMLPVAVVEGELARDVSGISQTGQSKDTTDTIQIGKNQRLATSELGSNNNNMHVDHRATYEKVPRVDAKRGQKGRDLEPAMDDLINAKTRPGFCCYRKPPTIYFGNDKTSEL